MVRTEVEDLLRTLAPQVLGALLRRHGTEQFDLCEDAVQEALLEAYAQWSADGLPTSPQGWLVTTARRRMIDRIRSDARRREREVNEARLTHPLADLAPIEHDDSLQLLLLCCHPSLTRSAQVALTLRTVAGLSTAQIARAYLLPEATIAQRISRAKAKIATSGARFPEPAGSDADQRLDAVLTVLYLMFNEAHTATSGDDLYNVDLATEAIRLARQVHRDLPDHGEAAGLVALMLLTDARRNARLDHGRMVPLDEQDRTRWDRSKINEGVRLVQDTLPGRAPTPYLVQAAIAALHDQAGRTEDTDWDEILALYTILEQLTGNPVVSLNRTVAAAMVHGPAYGLRLLDQLTGLPPDNHRLLAVRAHLLERLADPSAADVYLEAARRTTSIAERDYLRSRARRLR